MFTIPMNCSIVIRAYNEAGHLPRLLEGIQQQTARDVEIILVDSGSTDGTVSIAESYGAQVVRIPSDEFTFGRSLNFGVQAATRELVVIASAHVYPVYPDWLECLLRPFEDEDVALVYGKQRGMETSKFSEHQIFRQWFPDADVARQDSPFCNNANAAIRRSLWEAHPYDETLTGLEDLAWAKWAQGAGYAISYAAHAEIIHIHNETPCGIYNRYRREAMAFKRIFPESHFNVYDFVRLTVTNILSDLSHAARQRLFWKSFSSIFWFRFNQFWGTYQGYLQSGPVTQHLRQTFYYPHWSAGKSDERDVEPIRYNHSQQTMKIDFSLFSEKAQAIAQQSYEIALRYHQNHITREHVLVACLETPNEEIISLLEKNKVNVFGLKKRLEFLMSYRAPIVPVKEIKPNNLTVSVQLKRFIEYSRIEADRLGEEIISNEILFLALIQSYFRGTDEDRTLQEILEEYGITPEVVRKALLARTNSKRSFD